MTVQYVVKYENRHGQEVATIIDSDQLATWQWHPQLVCIHPWDEGNYAGCDCIMPHTTLDIEYARIPYAL